MKDKNKERGGGEGDIGGQRGKEEDGDTKREPDSGVIRQTARARMGARRGGVRSKSTPGRRKTGTF